jgi:hypothetical protein
MRNYIFQFLMLLTACSGLATAEDSGKLLQEMKQLSHDTVVNVKTENGLQRAELIPIPVFRYSDQPRRIVDASLWAWMYDGRLIALQKIEAVLAADDELLWQYCFASFTSSKLDVRWPTASRFQTTAPGVVFRSFATAPAPSAKPFIRLQQMKKLASRFRATISDTADGSDEEVMRLLPNPVFIYPQKPAAPTLGIFGLTSNGTNPDAYIILRAEKDSDELTFTYGTRRMTTGAVKVTLNGEEVMDTKYLTSRPSPKEAWTFFQVSRDESP